MRNKQYPLQWPIGWKRTHNPKTSRFEPGSAYAEFGNIVRQLKLMKATDIVLSSNMHYKADGTPYARQNVSDTGVAIYFTRDGREQCIPCDKWIRLEDNLRAIAKSIEALRGLDRWGAKDFVDAAFRGFQALPETATEPTARAWYDVLEVDPNADTGTVRNAYRAHIKRVHPDHGGSAAEFQEVQNAFNEYKSKSVND